MLAELGSGRYSPAEVDSVRKLLKHSPMPKEEEIAALPKKVRDVARGLATNFKEMKLLEEKRQQYGRVAAGAKDMSHKLLGNEKRAETLRPAIGGPGSLTPGGHENAAYPEKLKVASKNAEPNGSVDSSINGGMQAFLPGGNLDMVPDGKRLETSGDVATSGASKAPEGEKKLTKEGADLIAGMISELDYDMSKQLSSIEAEHALDAGKGEEPSVPENVEAGSTLGGALATLLGADKDLFRRVNEQMRRRAGKEL